MLCSASCHVLGHAMLCSLVCCMRTVICCAQSFARMREAAKFACVVYMHKISQAQQKFSVKQRLHVQRSTIDFVAITLGMVVALRKAAPQLILRRTPKRLCTLQNFAALLVTVLITGLLHWALQAYLQRQSFYQNRSSNSLVLGHL